MEKVRNILLLFSLIGIFYPIEFLFCGPIIINHNSTNLNDILNNEWLNNAKENLHIGYGHTSHGSQIISGMSALMSYYSDGRFNWSGNQVSGSIRIVEGGTLAQDVGYSGWDDKTRTYLDDNPQCNVIIWSWCGQVNDVDLTSHYLNRMSQLESEYPNVKFIYMTGHLEGQGPDGSLEAANNQIRNFCMQNNKILFDFADIEKYSPDNDINFDEFYADDGCNYRKIGGGTGNWANEWMQANPEHILTLISEKCGGCAHSVSLNCVRKGIASWQLWARLVGWDGSTLFVEDKLKLSSQTIVSPNPVTKTNFQIDLSNLNISNCLIEIIDIHGVIVKEIKSYNKLIINVDINEFSAGCYFVIIRNELIIKTERILIIK